MICNFAKSSKGALQLINGIQKTCQKSSNSLVSNLRSYSTEKTPDDEKIVLTEELPPIPPNLGWVGNESIKSRFEMRRIQESFKYGNPPRMMKKPIKGPLVMRLLPITHCSNRRFFRFAVTHQNYEANDPYVEDLGSIDPMPNKDNQILVALNIERIKYYLAKGVPMKGSVGTYLGLSGLLPIDPSSYLTAYRNRKNLNNKTNQEE